MGYFSYKNAMINFDWVLKMMGIYYYYFKHSNLQDGQQRPIRQVRLELHWQP